MVIYERENPDRKPTIPQKGLGNLWKNLITETSLITWKKELSKAIDALTCGKALSEDSIFARYQMQ